MKQYVSIIIPTYNRAEKLRRSIQSILNQTYHYFELIIVDDHSGDDIENVVDSFHDQRIIYIRNDRNSGPSVSRNNGIKVAKYDFIAFNDSDDIWLPEKLELQMQKMNADHEYGIVYSAYYLCFPDKKEKIPFAPVVKEQVEGYIFQSLWLENKIGTPTILVKKECIENVGAFNSDLHCIEDWEFVLRIAEKYKIGYIDKILVEAEASDSGVSSNEKAQIDTLLFLLDKYKGKDLFVRDKYLRILDLLAARNDTEIENWKTKLVPQIASTNTDLDIMLSKSREKSKIQKMNQVLIKINQNQVVEHFIYENKIVKDDVIAIYGAGNLGIVVADIFKRHHINISCFIDRNELSMENYKVISPQNLGEYQQISKMITTNIGGLRREECSWLSPDIELINIFDIIVIRN